MEPVQKPPYLELFGFYFAVVPIAALMAGMENSPLYVSLFAGVASAFAIEAFLAALIKGLIIWNFELLLTTRMIDDSETGHLGDYMETGLGGIILRLLSFLFFSVFCLILGVMAGGLAGQIAQGAEGVFRLAVGIGTSVFSFSFAGILIGLSLWGFADFQRSAIYRASWVGGFIGLLVGFFVGMTGLKKLNVLLSPLLDTGKETAAGVGLGLGLFIGLFTGIILWFWLTLRAFVRSGHSHILGFLWIATVVAFGAGSGILIVSMVTDVHQMLPSIITTASGLFLILLILTTRPQSSSPQ